MLRKTHPTDPEKSEQDYYRDRVNDIILKHGVGGGNLRKSSRISRIFALALSVQYACTAAPSRVR
ncbi:MAG: hypothetical protein Ct9H90mP26_2180 [Methanobacteriota archaeon]|nr:MAG: hypothetical protein Ct9H90mP26_2180 [Euryarchaeota archaeon]